MPAAPATVLPGLAVLLAHDVKTHLASVAMNLDFAIGEIDVGGKHVSPALDDCRQANARAIRLVSDMADAARLAAGDYQPKLGEVCCADVVSGVVRTADPDAAARGVQISAATDDATVFADPDLMRRALGHLLERALRHARAASRIFVEQEGAGIAIVVHTLAEAEMMSPNLSLAFAQAAMNALGGAVHVESPGGDTVVLRMRF